MVVFLSVLGLFLGIFLFCKLRLASTFRQEVKGLFTQSKNISNQKFHKSQLVGLPEPVQRYFNHVLKDGQSYISYARITHAGQFKAGLKKGWMNIKGEQYATTEKPGFIWKGTTAMFEARDSYIADRGRLTVTLFSLYTLVDAAGANYNQGELLRWLGESILYPTNFLPSERLQWLPIDSKTAKLSFQYKSLSLFFKITFNELGEITEMETLRYMDEKNLKPWVIKATNYQEFDQVRVPTAFDVLWRLADGDFSYPKFNITQVQYNQPSQF
jgi:hypothetical protein